MLLYNGRTLQSCLSLLFSLTRSTGNAFHRKDGSKVKVLCCEISLEYSFILYWFSAALIFLACHIWAGKGRIKTEQRSDLVGSTVPQQTSATSPLLQNFGGSS